jgi:translin
MERLDVIAEQIRRNLEAKDAARDKALQRSRELIRYCAHTIRAVHRDELDGARELLATARNAARLMVDDLAGFPDLAYAGYTQDALKEFVEASAVYALIAGEPLPSPQELNVEDAAYLNGLGEAAGELRRRSLDIIRRGHSSEAERLLEAMDDIYSILVTMDFPDAITGGLRRTTDLVRGVLERTRGDLTTSVRQQRLQQALAEFTRQLGVKEDVGATDLPQEVGEE